MKSKCIASFITYFFKKIQTRCSLPLEELGTSRMSYFTSLAGWVTRKGFKGTEVISKEFQWLDAHGITLKTVKKNEGLPSQEMHFSNNPQCTRASGAIQDKEKYQELISLRCLFRKKGGDEVNLVTLAHLKGIFSYFAGGLALSLAVFIVEVLTISCCKN